MVSNMQIRKCQETDIPAAGAFYDRVVLWLDQHVNYPKWIYRIYPSESFVREMTADGAQYLCEENGILIGAFALDADPQGSYQKVNWKHPFPGGSYMVIHALAIDPGMWKNGIASEVIRFCEDKAKADGCRALRVDIVPENLPARKLFEKNGFTWAGDADMGLGFAGIPVFSLYEKSW